MAPTQLTQVTTAHHISLVRQTVRSQLCILCLSMFELSLLLPSGPCSL